MRSALWFALVVAPCLAQAQVAQVPVAVAVPLQLEATPSTGYHATEIRFQVKVTTTKPGPKPQPTSVYVDGARDDVDPWTGTTKVELCTLDWSPTTAGTWAALCSKKHIVLRKPGSYPLTFSVQNAPNDPYSTGSAATTLTVAKTPAVIDLDVAPPKTPGTTRRLQVSVTAKNGAPLLGRDVELVIGATKRTAKSGAELEIPLSAGVVDVKAAFTGDDTALAASQTFSIPVADAKACAVSLRVTGKKVGPNDTELTFSAFLFNKWAWPIAGLPNKTLRLLELFGLELTTDATGRATKTVSMKGPASLWASRIYAATFPGDAGALPCTSPIIQASISSTP